MAWACSIHKSQGATLDFAEIDIKNIFEFGQAYVAISRVRTPEALIIKDYNVKKIKCHPKAVKFYRELEGSNYSKANTSKADYSNINTNTNTNTNSNAPNSELEESDDSE